MRMELPRRAVARVLGCSATALQRYQDRGADISDVDSLWLTIEAAGDRRGKLSVLLSDPKRRAEIAEEIKAL